MTVENDDDFDISLEEVRRISGHSRAFLLSVWSQIPTAFKSEGGRYFVSRGGYRRWVEGRSN